MSPIVGNTPVAGPAGILMTAQGLPCSIAGIAKAYEDFLDLLICDTRDAGAAEALRGNGLRVECAPSIMRTAEDKGRARQSRPLPPSPTVLSRTMPTNNSPARPRSPHRLRSTVILIPGKESVGSQAATGCRALDQAARTALAQSHAA